jgi:hypothetical protein
VTNPWATAAPTAAAPTAAPAATAPGTDPWAPPPPAAAPADIWVEGQPAPAVVTEAPDRETPGGHGIFGFVKNFDVNAFRDMGDFVGGISKLGTSLAHDTFFAANALVTAPFHGGVERPDNLITPDMTEAIFGRGKFAEQGSVFLNDYQKRYGGGGKAGAQGWAGNTLEQVFEHPLSFVSDALAAFTAVGKGAQLASSAAKAAGLATEVGAVAGEEGAGVAAKAGGTAAEELSALGGEGLADTAPAIAAKGSAEELSTAQKFVNAVDGQANRIWDPVGQKLKVVGQSLNPARRILYQNRFLDFVSRSTPWVEAQAKKYAALADAAGEDAPNYMENMAKAADYRAQFDAATKAGATRVYQPRMGYDYAASSGRKVVDFIVGQASGKTAKVTPEVMSAVEEALYHGVPDTLTDQERLGNIQGTDPTLTSDGIVAREGAGVRRAEQLDDPTGVDSFDTPSDVRHGQPDVPTVMIPAEDAKKLLEFPDRAPRAPGEAGTAGPQTIEYDPSTGKAIISEGMRRTQAATEDVGLQVKVVDTPTIERQGTLTPGNPAVELDPAIRARVEEALAGRAPEAVLPAKGTSGRAEFDATITRAKEAAKTRVPQMRTALGNAFKVKFNGVKGERAIRRKAEQVGGTYKDVHDIERYRAVSPDAWKPNTTRAAIQKVADETGSEVVGVQNTAYKAAGDGSRGITVTFKGADGNPFEVQFLTPEAEHVINATTKLRGLTATYSVLAKRGLLVGDDASRVTKMGRMSQALWEGVADDLRESLGGPAASEMRKRLNRMRVAVWEHMTDPLLDRGLDPNSVFDDSYLPMRHKAGGVYDAKARRIVGGPSPLELDDGLAQAGEMAPIYYPMMDATRLGERTGLMRGARGAGSGMRGIADRNLKRNTGEILAAGKVSDDIKTVYATRAAQSARMQGNMDILFDTADQFGRPIKSVDELHPGEHLFAPGMLKRISDQHNMLLDHLMNDPSGKGLGDLLDKLTADNAAKMRDLLESSGDDVLYAIPDHIAKRLNAHKKWITNDTLDIAFGTPTDLWRAAVLTGSPRWVINNMLGNTLFVKMQGAKLTDVLRQLAPKYRAKLRDAIGEVPSEQLEGGLFHSMAHQTKVYDDTEMVGHFANKMTGRAAGSRVGKVWRRYSDWVQSVNSAGEDAFRRASYMTAAEKTLERHHINNMTKSFWRSKNRLEAAFRVGLDEDQWREAVDEVNHYMNDYQTSTPFARNITKPYVAPFWSFYRHAAKLLLAMPFDHPAKFRLTQLLSEADDQRMRTAGIDPADMPGWMRGGALFTGRTESGDYNFMSGAGLNPFNSILENPVNMANPAMKIFWENQSGRSTFTGKPFTDRNVIQGPFGSAIRITKDANGNPVPVAEEHTSPGIMEHLLQQLPQYTMAKDLIAGGNTYDTSTLLDAINGRFFHGPSAALTNPKTGEVVSPKAILPTIEKMFGYSGFTTDLDKSQAYLQEQKTAALKAWLARQG